MFPSAKQKLIKKDRFLKALNEFNAASSTASNARDTTAAYKSAYDKAKAYLSRLDNLPDTSPSNPIRVSAPTLVSGILGSKSQ